MTYYRTTQRGLYRSVVVQFYPWFKFPFPMFLVIVMFNNEFETKGNKFETKKNIKLQHIHGGTYFQKI